MPVPPRPAAAAFVQPTGRLAARLLVSDDNRQSLLIQMIIIYSVVAEFPDSGVVALHQR
jgi:hypothetical protein